MRLAGRIAAAIEILDDFDARRVPLKVAIADWSRANRYAGAKDRAWISGICLDVLRRRNTLAVAMDDEDARPLILAGLVSLWGTDLGEIIQAIADGPHSPGAIRAAEEAALRALASRSSTTGDGVIDAPEFIAPYFRRAFGGNAAAELAAFGERAPIDLRVNTLKSTPEKAASAVRRVGAKPAPILSTALRIDAPDPQIKAPPVTVIPAYNKGWVEVQDLGSQIAAAAAGAIAGKQVLDFCAGGGGKTLALSALMRATGQIHSYDRDARRLRPLYGRAKRAGLRNLQIHSPADENGLDALHGAMDVVFVDAPCSGLGTWRRRPDTKWRLTPEQFEARLNEQTAVLKQAAPFVRPGGALIWVTCSVLVEENEDRLATFLAADASFKQVPVMPSLEASGVLSSDAGDFLRTAATDEGALRLTPCRTQTDGFFVARLRKELRS